MALRRGGGVLPQRAGGDDDRLAGELLHLYRPRPLRGGRHVYAGSHTFAIPTSVHDRPAALALLRFLTSEESQLVEARLGSLPTRPAVLAQVRAESPPGSIQARRWSLLEETTAAALFPPVHPRYPLMENALWRAVQRAIVGTITVEEALAEAAAGVREIVSGTA